MNASLRFAAILAFVLGLAAAPLGASQGAQNKAAAPSAGTKPPAAAESPQEEVPPAAPGALFPAVVARVNGKAVLGRDLEQRVQEQLVPMGSPKWSNLRDDYRLQLTTELLTAMIANELIYQKAVASGVKPTEQEIQAEVAKVSKNYRNDAEMNLALANRGLDRSGLQREIERVFTVTRYVDETIAKKIEVTPAEVTQYYSGHMDEFRHPDLVRTSHILIVLPETATAEQDALARQRAESLLARIKKGEDFAKLAKENSMDASASQGGDIGYAPKGQLAQQYENAAFALSVGQTSGVVRTQFGYHIIKLTDKKKEGISTLEEIRSDLTSFLRERRIQEELGKLVNQLRAQAQITVHVPVAVPAAASSPRQ